MKKIIIAVILLGTALFLGGYSAYRDNANAGGPTLRKLNDLNSSDYRLGLPLGAKSMYVGEEQFSDARPCYFNSHHAAYAALRQGKIDGYLFDSHTLDYVSSSSTDYTILPGSAGTVDVAIGIAEKNAELVGPINQFIERYRNDGTYQAMYKRWIKPTNSLANGFDRLEVPPMPQINAPEAPTRTLVVGTCSQMEPLCFRHGENKDYTGFDIELLRRLALHLNVRYVIRDLDYMTMMQELASGELDIVIAGLNKTDARIKRGILFSRNYIDSHIVAMVRSTDVCTEKNTSGK